ncbi:DedA family protein [Thermoleophilia bacterium SCSIO 60948]|nr:DedA family protein [Thermoleophilia bacterium SCSIO 60948]
MSSWAESALDGGGYPILASLILLENLVPPIPSEVILPLAGFYVFEGTLAFVPAVLSATAGSVIGALIIYAVGRYGGRPILERWGYLVRLKQRDLDRADAWFDKRARLFVFFGRLLPGIRSVVSVPAGLSEMPIAWFVGLTFLGSLLWNSLLIGAGSLLGANWERVSTVVGDATPIVLVAFVLACVGAAVYYGRRRRSRRARATG